MDGSVEIGDIVVTAQKRAENLQDTPLAITAVSSEGLEKRAAADVSAVAGFAPNVQFQGSAPLSGGSFNATVFIRGVGQNDASVFNDPGVGVYLDGVYLGRTTGAILELADIERVEVLRGPQGTLFGKNAVGGAVSVISKMPTNHFEGKANLTYGNYDRIDASATLSGPIVSDKLLARFSIGKFTRDGYVRRLSDGADLGDKNLFGMKGQLRFLPTDTLTVDLAGDYSRIRQNSAALTMLHVADGGFPFLDLFNAFVAPGTGIVAPNGVASLNSSFITGDPFTTHATGPNVNDLDSYGLSLTANWDVGLDTSLRSITAYRSLDAHFARDGDNTPYNFRHTDDIVEQWQFSQELQLIGSAMDDRLDYVLGVYYLKEKAKDLARITLAEGVYDPNAAPPRSLTDLELVFDQFIRIRTNSYAAFANATYHLTDSLSTTLGLRYTRESKRFETYEQRIVSETFIVDEAGLRALYGEYPLTDSWSDLSPRIGLEYKAGRDVLLYGSVSKGFKSGSFNGRATSGPGDIQPFDPEIVWNYEAGVKTQWFDRKLTLNIAGFYMDYKDIQVTVNRTPQNFVANAAAARLKGFEAEFRLRPVPGLNFDGSVGYLDAEYTKVGGSGLTLPITLDSKLVRAPEWTVNVGAEYSLALAGGELMLRGDLQHVSKQYYDAANTPLISQPAYTLLNGRIAYTTADEAWTIALFGSNLTDKRYLISGNAASPAFGSITEGTYGRPREYGVSLTARF